MKVSFGHGVFRTGSAMSSVQFDYSCLSTSISQGDFANSSIHNMIEGIAEETSSSTSEESVDATTTGNNIPDPPVDRYSIVYIVFGLLGIGTLLPWNYFITAHDYWMYKFRNESVNKTCFDPNQRTELQSLFTTYLTVASNGSYVTFLMICAVFNERFPQFQRTVASLLAMIITFVAMTALVEVNTDDWQNQFFAVTMALVVLMGVSSAILQAAVAGVASVLPPKYMHAMVLGQALAGIVATVTQIATLMGHCSAIKSAFGYFLSADIYLFIMLLSYLWIQKSAFFQFHLHHCQGNRILKDVTSSSVMANISSVTVFKRVWPYAVTVLIDFWVTIGIFPGVAVLVVSVHYSTESPWTSWLFIPMACFMVFNVGDFCGRIVGGWLPFKPKWKFYLLAISFLRIVFVPLFLLCNAQPRTHLPVIFNEDTYYITFVGVLGFTNGCLVTIAMINGTKYISPDLREMAGVLLSAFLAAGLLLGAVSSFIFVKIL